MVVLLLHACLVLGIIAVPGFVRLTQSNAVAAVSPLCILLSVICTWCVVSWAAVARYVFCPYTIFLLAAILFNASQAFLQVADLNQSGLLSGRFPAVIEAQTLYLVLLGLSGLHLGALVGVLKTPFHTRATRHGLPTPQTDAALIRTGLALLAISIVPMASQLLRSIAIVIQSGYSSLYQQDAETGMQSVTQIAAHLFIPGALFVMIGGRRRGTLRWGGLALIFIYSLLMLFVGTRGWAIMPIIAAVWAWHRIIRRIPSWLVLAGSLAVLILVFPMVEIARGLEGGDRMSPEAWLASLGYHHNILVRSIAEMGGSMRTIAHTLELVPAVRPFDYGRSYLANLSAVIPNLFWETHPAVQYGQLGRWLTEAVDPMLYRRGGGVGFSFLAEAYLSFGWYGTPLAMAAIGYAFGRLSHWGTSSGDAAKVAAMAVFLSFALYWPRGELHFVIRPLVWYAIPAYLLAMCIRASLLQRCPRLYDSKAFGSEESDCCGKRSHRSATA